MPSEDLDVTVRQSRVYSAQTPALRPAPGAHSHREIASHAYGKLPAQDPVHLLGLFRTLSLFPTQESHLPGSLMAGHTSLGYSFLKRPMPTPSNVTGDQDSENRSLLQTRSLFLQLQSKFVGTS